MATQKSWVFKTPHTQTKRRDEGYRVVDVCLATSAAPMFLPIASIPDPDDRSHLRTLVDGGLWANNPVLIGMIEALEVAGAGQSIEILSVGTCAPPEASL
jgi:patatin-like phospholipase/acyl hydrolase